MTYGEWRIGTIEEEKRYPVIFFTHGAGSRGTDFSLIENNVILNNILSAIEKSGQSAIVFAPQCSSNTWFDVFERLIGIVRSTYDMPLTDKDRFYGVGVSMGGYAMVQLMQSLPDLFAAGIVCCGGGMYWNAGRMQNIALRLFHGEKDTTVYPEESVLLYEKLKEIGGEAELFLFPECDHNCWDKTLQDVSNMEWLLSRTKSGR